MSSSTNKPSNLAKNSSFGQTLQFITDIKLKELEKQRLAYQAHAKVIEEANSYATQGEVLQQVEVLAAAVKSWSGSGSLKDVNFVGGKLHMLNLDFWLQQAKKDPSFSREIAQGWAEALEEHIRHNTMRFDAAKLFGSLFNEWLDSGDSSAVAYQQVDEHDADVDIDVDVGADPDYEYVQAEKKEVRGQREKLESIIFDDYPIDATKLNDYLEKLFSSEEGVKALDRLRKELKAFSDFLQQKHITTRDVQNAIKGLFASGLLDEEKRATLKAFEGNDTILNEVASVLNMRMASIETWSWPEEGLVIEFQIVDGILLQYIGVSWQVKLKVALRKLFDSKAWIQPTRPHPNVVETRTQQLQDDGHSSVAVERRKIQREDFFLSRLHNEAANPIEYDDDVIDKPDNKDKGVVSPAMVKQKLLHIMATECHLNNALHGSHAMIRSDLEWFAPSMPHTSVLTVFSFLGVSSTWLGFFKAFLKPSLRFFDETESRTRRRGTPISYALHVLSGEALLFIMDYAVNQRTKGLHLYRMHDDLWLWDHDVKMVSAAWAEMSTYTELAGLKFNERKTGSAYVGPPADVSGLPNGDIRWGFLTFSPAESRFIIDQKDVDNHILKMRRQLASTKSVFGWINAYNKYMTFVLRNFGGIPGNCFSKEHTIDMIDTLGRIQRELFPDTTVGGAVRYLKKMIEERFGITGLPEGYFYFPIASGGLELRNTMLELLALERQLQPLTTVGDASVEAYNEVGHYTPFYQETAIAHEKFPKRKEFDAKIYAALKEAWEFNSEARRYANHRVQSVVPEAFMPFSEYTSLRETWINGWGQSYLSMLDTPNTNHVLLSPKVREMMSNSLGVKQWYDMDWYEKWVISMYGEEVAKKFGGLAAVDPNLIPVAMVELFKTSRMKLN